jgi:hypothetical protein
MEKEDVDHKKKQEKNKKKLDRLKSKRASVIASPLLTNPLNSCTKLQISATLQNKFLSV